MLAQPLVMPILPSSMLRIATVEIRMQVSALFLHPPAIGVVVVKPQPCVVDHTLTAYGQLTAVGLLLEPQPPVQ